MMNVNFTKYFTPFQRLMIDESLVAYFLEAGFSCFIAKKASIYVGSGTFSKNWSHFFIVLKKTHFVVFYCKGSQYFMLNLIIVVCTSRRH